MKYPVITHYKEALLNIEERLRTLSGISPVLDKRGEPLFHASKGYVTFIVARDGVHTSLRCFTTADGYNRAATGELYEYELFVFDDNQVGDYYTIMLDAEVARVETPQEGGASEFAEGLNPFESEMGLWGYKLSDGRVVIEPQYESATEFSEGRAVVGKGGLYGLINTDGALVLNIEYDEISWDGSSIAYLEKGGRWGASDRAARIIFECRYDWVGEYSNGLLLVCQLGKYGYVDIYGNEVIPLVYNSGTSFDDNGIATVTAAGLSRIINTSGEFV